MADETKALMSYLRSRTISDEFKPCAYYGPEEDAVNFFFRDEADYAKRVNEWLTLYLSIDTDELVGCQIKGVGRVLEDMGHFGIDVTHRRVKLRIVFLAFLSSATDDPVAREYYRRLGKAAAETDPELEIPKLV